MKSKLKELYKLFNKNKGPFTFKISECKNVEEWHTLEFGIFVLNNLKKLK